MKKVWKYIIISLLLLLGLCCIGILYLFFIPNSTLFHITYVNHNKKYHSAYYQADEVSHISLNSRKYNVNVLSSEEDTIYVELYCNSFGFVLTKNENPEISSFLRDQVLTFNIKETYGFAIHNESYVNLYLPKSKTFNLELTNEKAETKIKSSDVHINNLSYKTNKGDFKFVAGTIDGTLLLNLNKSHFEISPNVQTNSNNVELKLTTGRFKSNNILGNVEIKENKRGVISINECYNLRAITATSGGQIYINKTSFVNVVSSDTIINIDTVEHVADITLTKSGSITINNLQDNSFLATTDGKIVVNNAASSLVLSSTHGNILVKSAKDKVNVSTQYGTAEIYFSEDATNRTLYAKIHDGKLIANGVESVGSADIDSSQGINITGNGRINLTMKNVLGTNKINGKNGNIFIIVESTAEYILKTSSSTGNVRVNLCQISNSKGYTTKSEVETKVNCSSSSNNLTVRTENGDLTLLDNIMFENGF